MRRSAAAAAPARRARLGLLGRRARAELDPERLELALELLDVVVGEVVLERERLELRGSTKPRSSAPSTSARACSDSSSSCHLVLRQGGFTNPFIIDAVGWSRSESFAL